jgi:5'-phosphate synthase pdxT subunit
MHVGVLALQGGFAAHAEKMRELGVSVVEVRRAEQLADIDGLILPGGESGALLRLLAPWQGLSHLAAFAATGRPIFGTCAGLILLAAKVEPQQDSLGLLDITATRNAYGRQIDSAIASGVFSAPDEASAREVECVFIRAPKISRVGEAVDVLVHCQGEPVMVQQGALMAATFHPELSVGYSLHQHFLQQVRRTATA